MALSVTRPKLHRWAPLPLYQQVEIIELYHASSDELGHSPRRRQRSFEKIVKLYYSWFNTVDLLRAWARCVDLENLRECRATANRLHDTHSSQILELFGKADDDGNGTIDLEEFRKVFSQCLGRINVDRYFKEADLNGDGHVDMREFFAFVSRTPQVMLHFQTAVDRAQFWADDAREEKLSLIFKVRPGLNERPSLCHVRSVYDILHNNY